MYTFSIILTILFLIDLKFVIKLNKNKEIYNYKSNILIGICYGYLLWYSLLVLEILGTFIITYLP